MRLTKNIRVTLDTAAQAYFKELVTKHGVTGLKAMSKVDKLSTFAVLHLPIPKELPCKEEQVLLYMCRQIDRLWEDLQKSPPSLQKLEHSSK